MNLISITQGQLNICWILSDTVATGGQDDSGDDCVMSPVPGASVERFSSYCLSSFRNVNIGKSN